MLYKEEEDPQTDTELCCISSLALTSMQGRKDYTPSNYAALLLPLCCVYHCCDCAVSCCMSAFRVEGDGLVTDVLYAGYCLPWPRILRAVAGNSFYRTVCRHRPQYDAPWGGIHPSCVGCPVHHLLWLRVPGSEATPREHAVQRPGPTWRAVYPLPAGLTRSRGRVEEEGGRIKTLFTTCNASLRHCLHF
jgi:hypothetical protein